jgi:endoglucanase
VKRISGDAKMKRITVSVMIKFISATAAISFLLISLHSESGPGDHRAALFQKKILINQLGYKPDDLKLAFVKSNKPDSFIITDAEDRVVLSGILRVEAKPDGATGDELSSIDFTLLTKPGTYKISVPALNQTSYKFSIDNSIYAECAIKTLQSFYYQRCSTEVNNGTIWNHPVCHNKFAVLYEYPDKELDVTGGWHDAGDYNKFVPTTAVSAAFLLYAYEINPGFFYDGQLNVPESSNSIPDVLDEAVWALKWLLKMQREDGAVYHKVSIKEWTAEHLPEEETDPQYVFGISSTSTADAAAVMALGARLIKKYDEQLSLKLLKFAVKAWKYLIQNPGNSPEGGFKNPPGVRGGEYGDRNDSDERLWASVELYRLTGSEEYLDYFLNNYKIVAGPNYAVSWQNTANFGYYSFFRIQPSLKTSEARTIILSRIKRYGDDLVRRTESGGYRCVLKNNQFYWGSNSTVAGYAYDLINLYIITKNQDYIQVALDQLHYLLGRNTFGVSFITGVGSDPVKYPYHQLSMLKYSGNPVPGLLVAGPNSYSKLNGKSISEMPGKCYEDYEKNYYVNEPAINYTAPMVYIASYFSQGEQKNLSKKNPVQINRGME